VIKDPPNYKSTGQMVHQRMSKSAWHHGQEHDLPPVGTFGLNNHICFATPLFNRSLFEGMGHSSWIFTVLASIRSVMRQMLPAFEFLHSLRIVHCDVTPRTSSSATNGVPTLS
jgi:serine/threonine protein kinase